MQQKEESHEEAEIQRKALKLRKILASSEDTSLKTKIVRVEGDPTKSWSGIEAEGKLNKKRWCWKLASWESNRKGDLTYYHIERNTPVFRPALQLNQNSVCSLHSNRARGGGGSNGEVISK